MIPTWVWRFLPWGLALACAVTAVKMYGDKREAVGAVNAHVETADRLQKQLTADSVANALKMKEQADSIKTLNRTYAAATVQAAVAKKNADAATTELRETLSAEQKEKLDAITTAHDKERSAWAAKEAVWSARLALKSDSIAVLSRENVQLREINASLRRATELAQPGHGASFVQRVSPYIAAAVTVAYGVDKLMQNR